MKNPFFAGQKCNGKWLGKKILRMWNIGCFGKCISYRLTCLHIPVEKNGNAFPSKVLLQSLNTLDGFPNFSLNYVHKKCKY